MKEKKKKRRQEELPDYTVAHMDVDGMPWNSKRPWQLLPGDPARESRKKRSLHMQSRMMHNRMARMHFPHFSQNKNRTS